MAARLIGSHWLHWGFVHGSKAVSLFTSLPHGKGVRAVSSLIVNAPLISRVFGAVGSLGRVWAVGRVPHPPAIPPEDVKMKPAF